MCTTVDMVCLFFNVSPPTLQNSAQVPSHKKLRAANLLMLAATSAHFVPMLVPVPDTVDFTTEPMRHRCVSPWTCSLRSRSNLLRCDMCQEPIPSPGERSNQAEKTMYKCQGSERRKVVDIRTWCPVSCPRKMESVAPETLFGLFDGAQGWSEFDERFQIGAGTVSEKMRSPITFLVTVESNTCFVGGTSKQQKN